jgi:hypothetical protein
MATKNIKKIAVETSDIAGLKSSRYEKLQVSYGAIASSQYAINDTLSFSGIPSQDIIRATVIAHSATPGTLEVYPASDKNSTFTLTIPGSTTPVDLSYIVEYVRGTGQVGSASGDSSGEGQEFKVTIAGIGTGAYTALSTTAVAALDRETQIAPGDV